MEKMRSLSAGLELILPKIAGGYYVEDSGMYAGEGYELFEDIAIALAVASITSKGANKDLLQTPIAALISAILRGIPKELKNDLVDALENRASRLTGWYDTAP